MSIRRKPSAAYCPRICTRLTGMPRLWLLARTMFMFRVTNTSSGGRPRESRSAATARAFSSICLS
ncbi:hypothetical protein IWW55_001374, partial [Coemansia sp. RSA 2706]